MREKTQYTLEDLNIRPPTMDDARRTHELMVRCDVAEYGEPDMDLSDLTFEWGRIELARDALLNGTMLHAKELIRIGCESRLAFGSRIFDADLHDLDPENRERIAPVIIGDRVWIGADALVLRGVTIGDDSVIGAGSIVTRDIPPRSLAVGSPAVVIKELAPRYNCQ